MTSVDLQLSGGGVNAAMTQATDPVTLALTGQLPVILLIAAALSWPISSALLRLYRRAVLRYMQARANPEATASVPMEPVGPAGQPPQTVLELVVLDQSSSLAVGSGVGALASEVLRGPWRGAAIYTVAGCCYALIMTISTLVAGGHTFLPLRFLIVFWNFAWPVGLTIAMVAASTRGVKLITISSYFLVFGLLGAYAGGWAVLSMWKHLALLWLMNLLVTVLLLGFLNRRVRAVGPLVLTFMVVATAGAVVLPSIAGGDDQRHGQKQEYTPVRWLGMPQRLGVAEQGV